MERRGKKETRWTKRKKESEGERERGEKEKERERESGPLPTTAFGLASLASP